MATPTETLQAWDTYISDYQSELASKYASLDTTNQTQMQEYAIQSAHLTELKRKRQYLQDYYAQYGNLPANVTFDATDAGIALYRRGEGLEPIAVTLIPGRSGETIAQSEDFTLSISFDTAHAGNSAPGANGLNNIGVKYTGASNVWFNTTWTDSRGYLTGETVNIAHFTNDIFGFGANLNYIPVVASGTRARLASFGQGILIHLDGDTIPTETPWDYYNNEILPDIHPENAVFPDGYDTTPDKPEPEYPELPGETENGGDDMERNDTTGVGGSFGFLTQYALRGSDIENLGQKLWNGFKSNPSDPDYPDDVTKYLLNFVYSVNPDTGSVNMSDIMEFFVSLKMYPFPLGNVHTLSSSGHNLYIGSGTKPIVMNNIIYTMDSYLGTLDCGTLTIPFWFGDYRDYELEIVLYLPYCGTVQLNPGDVLGGIMQCDYVIDFCTGSCTAYVDCTTWDNHKITVATLSGQIGADVPMSATNAGRVASRVLNDRINVAENILSPLKAATTGIGAVMAGNFAGGIRQGFDVFISPAINEQKQLAGMGERGAISAPVLGGGGGFSAFASLPAVFCQVRSPFFTDADNYADSVGLPSSETVIIGNCTGFCAFHNVDMSSLQADADTVNEIRRLLESGVFI